MCYFCKMIEQNLDKLMDSYVTHIRFNSKDNKLFGKIHYEYIADLNKRLGLPGSDNKINDVSQIVRKLITDYHYFGEYTYGPVKAFLEIYRKAQNGNIIDYAKLQHLEYKIEHATPLIKAILNTLNSGASSDSSSASGDTYYQATQSEINKFKNQKFMQNLAKQCAAEDMRRQQQQQQELEDQYQLQQLEDQKRQQELEDQYRQYHIEQQQQQKYIDAEKNSVINEPLQNDFLANKEMAQQAPQQAPQRRSHGRIGMNELANIVLGMQRDFKRVANALSVQGAQEIIEKHNDNSPNAPWNLLHQDVNRDGIPDIIIRNENNEPIVVNGWTTKGSDYPERYRYYNTYPTREARRAHPYPAYKRNE